MRIDRMAALLLMALLVVAVATITGCPKPVETETPDIPTPPPVETSPEPTEEATDDTEEADEEATEADEEATETDEATDEADEDTAAAADEWITTDSGLKIQDVEVGDGAEAEAGKTVFVLYTGSLEDGTVFDASYKHGGTPIDFVLGTGGVIAGWDEGIAGMKVGGKRNLEIPTELAYSYGDLAGETLFFECELVDVK